MLIGDGCRKISKVTLTPVYKRRQAVKGGGRSSGRREESRWERIQRARLIEAHDILCGSIPSLFMREINVVRLISMRSAAPPGPATRPFVIFRKRTISSLALASR